MKRVRATGPLEAYIVYHAAGEDQRYCSTLEKHLGVLVRQREIVIRHERLITAGKDLRAELSGMLELADVVILLVSPDFITSDFCYADQLEMAMKRHQENKSRVIPVIVRPCYWEEAPFAVLQPLPANRKAIASHKDKESAWKHVAKGIHMAVKDLRRNPAAEPTDADATTTEAAPTPAPPVQPAQTGAMTPSSSLSTVVAIRDAYRLLNAYHRHLFAIVRKVLQRTAKSTGELRASGWDSTQFDLPTRRDKLPIDKWAHDYQPLANAYFWWATHKAPTAGAVLVSLWHCGDDAVEKSRRVLPAEEPNIDTLTPVALSRSTVGVFAESVMHAPPDVSIPDWEYVDTIIENAPDFQPSSWYDGAVHECTTHGLIRYGGFECDMSVLLDIKGVDEHILPRLKSLIEALRIR